MPESAVGGKGGISRRKLLARGAVATGVVWAAPVIRTTSAYAATSDGTERPATRFFVVAIDASNQSWSVFPEGQADLPPTWEPSSVGNGWPEPWDGEGEPPWAQTAAEPASTRVYTYEAPTVVAGPGSSVSFGRRTEVEPLLDEEAIAADDPEMPDSAQFSERIGADLPDPLPPPIVDWVYANPGIELESPDRRPGLTQVGEAAWACVLPAPPTLPDWWSRRYRLVLGCYKDGNYFGGDGYEDPSPPSSELGRRLIFPTDIVRVGGYTGRAGHPGRAGPDQVNTGEVESTHAGAPGAARPAAGDDPAQPDDPARPREPDQPRQPELPGSGTDPASTSTTTTTRPGAEPPWDPSTCTPDPKAPFPWNLKFPDNFIVAWFGPRLGLQIPKAPESACLPPPPPPGPAPAEPDGVKGGDGPSGSTTTSASTTTTVPGSDPASGSGTVPAPAGTTPEAPASAASAAPQGPSSAIRHERVRRNGSRKVRYSHNGHLGDHECIVLVYCRP